LTADTRVLLSAGTLVDVSKDTADVILKLGRCVVVPEEKAVIKAESEGEPEAVEEKKTSKKKGIKKD
jgi:septum formation inhibitor-activating ATPase MinD